MNRDERRGHFRHYIGLTMAQQTPLLRHITFVYPLPGARTGQPAAEVVIDGQEPGRLQLVVRSEGLTAKQALALQKHGFEQAFDSDDPRSATYVRAVEEASVEDLVTFVEWAYRRVFDAPDDYAATITPLAAREDGAAPPSCTKTCSRLFAAIMLILVVVFLIMLFLTTK